jgi:hypothetical protein
MVNSKTAFKVAGGSALAVGIIYYLAQKWITQNPIMLAIIVALSVFGIGYFGMVKKK